jgi:hypothetical protein
VDGVAAVVSERRTVSASEEDATRAHLTSAEVDILCADVGSIPRGNFGWAGLVRGECVRGQNIALLALLVAQQLVAGRRVALGFEAPLFIPLPVEPELLGKARAGEPLAWSATAGASALATALPQVPWVLARVRQAINRPLPAYLAWAPFVEAPYGLLLWEACVSGPCKTGTHCGDAELAVRTFEAALPDPSCSSLVRADAVVSLVGAALVQTGWSSDVAMLSTPCLVLGPSPKPKGRAGTRRQ